jgi:hypothetical protein
MFTWNLSDLNYSVVVTVILVQLHVSLRMFV